MEIKKDELIKEARYKFNKVNVYSSTEWMANSTKKYRSVFDTKETTYIYTELSFYNKLFDEQDWEAKINLKCFSLDGKNRKELKINTFANKCSFNSAGTTVYCGIPQEQKYGYGLEPGLLDGIGDDIYRIDIATGSKTKVATPLNGFGQATFSVDDDSMVITEDSGQLFFRDKLTGQLIKIDL